MRSTNGTGFIAFIYIVCCIPAVATVVPDYSYLPLAQGTEWVYQDSAAGRGMLVVLERTVRITDTSGAPARELSIHLKSTFKAPDTLPDIDTSYSDTITPPTGGAFETMTELYIRSVTDLIGGVYGTYGLFPWLALDTGSASGPYSSGSKKCSISQITDSLLFAKYSSCTGSGTFYGCDYRSYIAARSMGMVYGTTLGSGITVGSSGRTSWLRKFNGKAVDAAALYAIATPVQQPAPIHAMHAGYLHNKVTLHISARTAPAENTFDLRGRIVSPKAPVPAGIFIILQQKQHP